MVMDNMDNVIVSAVVLQNWSFVSDLNKLLIYSTPDQ